MEETKMNSKFKIRIKKDTPFDKKGEEMTVADFRLKYGYICTESVTDQDLIDYIKSFQMDPVGTIDEWFEVIEITNPAPLDAIIDGVYYSKNFSGYYSMYAINSNASIGEITGEEFSKRLHKKKIWRTVTLATNNHPF